LVDFLRANFLQSNYLESPRRSSLQVLPKLIAFSSNFLRREEKRREEKRREEKRREEKRREEKRRVSPAGTCDFSSPQRHR
jgi:hypothetical protein